MMLNNNNNNDNNQRWLFISIITCNFKPNLSVLMLQKLYNHHIKMFIYIQ